MVRRKRVRAKVVKTKGGCKDCESKTRLSYPPGPRCASCHRLKKNDTRTSIHDAYVLKTYGITGDEYWKIFEHQGGRCAICKRANGSRRRLSVDHRHSDGLVRMLACSTCNRLLGHLRDDPEAFRRAADCLENPPACAIVGNRYTPEGGAPVKGLRGIDSEKRNK